jgi:hypothetical protein
MLCVLSGNHVSNLASLGDVRRIEKSFTQRCGTECDSGQVRLWSGDVDEQEVP